MRRVQLLQGGCVNGVAGLGVTALEIQQVAGFKTYAAAAKAYAGGGERTQSSSKRGSELRIFVLAHSVSSLSG
jgi:hypothetical protein